MTTQGDTTTIKVFEERTGGGFIPKGGKLQDFPQDPNFQPAVGDVFTFTSDLLQDQTKVGTDGGRCTHEVKGKPDTNHCVVTLTFPDGTLIVDQTLEFSDSLEPIDLPIVSGAGKYSGATGNVQVTPDPKSDGEDSFLAITFTADGGSTQVSQMPSGGASTGGGHPDASTKDGLWLLALGAARCWAASPWSPAAARRPEHGATADPETPRPPRLMTR